MIVLAFIAGYMLKGMIEPMCRGRSVEGMNFGSMVDSVVHEVGGLKFGAMTSGKPEYGPYTQGSYIQSPAT